MVIREVFAKKEWESFILSLQPNVFLQSWNWGETHRGLGKQVFRWGLFAEGKMVAAAQVIKETARRGDYFTLPGGPLLVEWRQEWLKTLFQELRRKAQEEKVVFIRVRPNIENNPVNRQLFQKMGFIKAPMHLHAESTLRLDLTKPLAEIMKEMRKNTRYAIHRAEREGVKTEISQDPAEVKTLYRLQMATVKRQRFIPFSEEFFRSHFQAFRQDKQIAFVKAIYQQQILAIGMFIFYADTAIYHYSGSSDQQRHKFASSAMIWQAIQEAKKRGCLLFDLWGLAPADQPRHRFSGVSLFKRGFGGNEIHYLPAQDLVLTPFYWLTYLFETWRRLQRRL